MGEGVVLWPVFPSHGDDRTTFFFLVWNFPFWDFLGTNLFLAETLFKYSKYSFLFGVDVSFHGSSPSLGIWSTPPCLTQPRKCLKQKYKKGRLFFYRVESIFCQKEMWKTVLKLLTTATKISWQYELIDAFLQWWAGFKATRQWAGMVGSPF